MHGRILGSHGLNGCHRRRKWKRSCDLCFVRYRCSVQQFGTTRCSGAQNWASTSSRYANKITQACASKHSHWASSKASTQHGKFIELSLYSAQAVFNSFQALGVFRKPDNKLLFNSVQTLHLECMCSCVCYWCLGGAEKLKQYVLALNNLINESHQHQNDVWHDNKHQTSNHTASAENVGLLVLGPSCQTSPVRQAWALKLLSVTIWCPSNKKRGTSRQRREIFAHTLCALF